MFRPFHTRIVAALLAASILFTSMGVVVLPVQGGLGSLGMAYPCQGGQCGCHSAAQCWIQCCCHTDAEKVAWAKAHGVTPPREVVARAKLEAKSAAKRACCQHCSKEPARVQKKNGASSEAKFRVATVSAWKTCGGYESHHAALLHRICEKPKVWSIRLQPRGWKNGAISPCWENVATAPTPPPPEMTV